MTFTYADPSASRKDAVRFLVGDTDPAVPLLTDEEIAYLLAEHAARDSVYWVAAEAASLLSTRAAQDVDVSGDGVDVRTGDLQARWTAVATELRARYTASQAFGGAGPDFETERPKHFAVGMDDNRWVGGVDQEPWIPDGTIGPAYTP